MPKSIHPILVRLFFLLVFIAAASAAYVLLPENHAWQLNRPNIETGLQNPKNNQILPNSTILEANTTPNNQKPLQATLKTPGITYKLTFQSGDNLLQVMRNLSASSIKPFSFLGKEYPNLGFFVETINGTKNNPQSGEYWIYYINGQPAQQGISFYKLQPNDLIEWKFEKSKF